METPVAARLGAAALIRAVEEAQRGKAGRERRAAAELRTLAVGIYSLQNQYFSDWGMMSAASTIALLPIIVVFIVLQRYFIASFSGAVKG